MGTIKEMIALTQGEILKILIDRDERSVEAIAEAMGIHRTYLSKLYKLDRLPKKTLKAAIMVLGVDEEWFAESSPTGAAFRPPNAAELDELRLRIIELEKELEGAKTEAQAAKAGEAAAIEEGRRLELEALRWQVKAYEEVAKRMPGLFDDPDTPIKAAFEK